mmetsp:Transcript_10461/g.14819  ORF Transcript_10461/g.14819 Transcript_10461/m.14819 type:complete len:153 (+) Transcript_10461:64-522(+)
MSMATGITALRRLTRATIQRQQRRWMGSDMPTPQSMKAELWQGHSKEPEGWETTIYLTYAAAAVLFVGVAMAPDTSIQHWAQGEAQARLDLKAEGKVTEFEFGKHYNTPESSQEEFDSFMLKSIKPGEDDDDDDEDEDEDEEEDEEEEEDDE